MYVIIIFTVKFIGIKNCLKNMQRLKIVFKLPLQDFCCSVILVIEIRKKTL